MNPTATVQIAIDNTLVAPEDRLTIGKCNSRISFSKPQREATYQFWNSVNKVQGSSSRFKLNNKKFKVDVEVFRDDTLRLFLNWSLITCINPGEHLQMLSTDEYFAFQIDNHYSKDSMPYPRFTKIIISRFISQNKSISMRNRINLHTVRDDTLLGTLKYVSKTKEHQVYGAVILKEVINEDILNSTTYKTYYAYASGAKEPKKARKFKKLASTKLKTVPVSPKEPTKKLDKKTIHAKKSSKSPAGVIIKDTSNVSVSKKKASVKGKRSKGVPDEQQRTSSIDEGNSTKLGVPNVPKYQSESNDESWGDSEDDDNDDDGDDVSKGDDDKADSDDDGNDAHYSERTDSYDDENPFFTLKDYEEEEHDVEYVQSPKKDESDDDNENMDEEEYDDLYMDVGMKSLRAEHEKEGKGDVKMTKTTHESVSQENSYEQVIEDAHLTLTSSQKTEGSKQSSSVSSDFARKFLNLDNAPQVIDEVASLMNGKTPHEESSTQAPLILSVPVTAIPKTFTIHATTIP
uniref:Uncharacterized protein n=1 Tax=Tanacetum cinerariifolium TaxID=118510 RepID=A0A699HX38_TANCI|nr:hypothetical protein [Tanacetum cinerariifolium]